MRTLDYLRPRGRKTTVILLVLVILVWGPVATVEAGTADFTFSPASGGQAPLDVQFTNTSTGITGAATFLWDFGGENTSTSQNPSYQFFRAGNRAVSLTVNDTTGPSTIVKYVPVFPRAQFTATPSVGDADLTVQFTDQSTGIPGNWSWNFISGTTPTSYAQNPSYLYTLAGEYTVNLTVRGDDFLTNTSLQNVTVRPKNNFTSTYNSAVPAQSRAPLTIAFTDQSMGSPDTWFWNFGDQYNATLSATSVQNPSHPYLYTGVYTASLIARGRLVNGTPAATQVLALRPTAAFNASRLSGVPPFGVTFTANTFSLPPVWSANNTNFAWNFGDGTVTSTDINPFHVYTRAGRFTVNYTINFIDPGTGQTMSDSTTGTITSISPFRPPFRANINGGNTILQFRGNWVTGAATFTARFVPSLPVYFNQPNIWTIWDFGDGSGLLPVPYPGSAQHTYAGVGAFDVTMIVATASTVPPGNILDSVTMQRYVVIT